MPIFWHYKCQNLVFKMPKIVLKFYEIDPRGRFHKAICAVRRCKMRQEYYFAPYSVS